MTDASDTPTEDDAPTADTSLTRPELTVSEAARACSVDRRTIGRRLRADAFPNAHKLEDGTWRIPVPDLIAAGLLSLIHI